MFMRRLFFYTRVYKFIDIDRHIIITSYNINTSNKYYLLFFFYFLLLLFLCDNKNVAEDVIYVREEKGKIKSGVENSVDATRAKNN